MLLTVATLFALPDLNNPSALQQTNLSSQPVSAYLIASVISTPWSVYDEQSAIQQPI